MNIEYVVLSVITFTSFPDAIDAWEKSKTTNGRKYTLLAVAYLTPVLGALLAIAKRIANCFKQKQPPSPLPIKKHDIQLTQQPPLKIVSPIVQPIKTKIENPQPVPAPQKAPQSNITPASTPEIVPLTPSETPTPKTLLSSKDDERAEMLRRLEKRGSNRDHFHIVSRKKQKDVIDKKVKEYRDTGFSIFLKDDKFRLKKEGGEGYHKITHNGVNRVNVYKFLQKYKEEGRSKYISKNDQWRLDVAFYALLLDQQAYNETMKKEDWCFTVTQPVDPALLNWLGEKIAKQFLYSTTPKSAAKTPTQTPTPRKNIQHFNFVSVNSK